MSPGGDHRRQGTRHVGAPPETARRRHGGGAHLSPPRRVASRLRGVQSGARRQLRAFFTVAAEPTSL